jgi:hypothetical protein
LFSCQEVYEIPFLIDSVIGIRSIFELKWILMVFQNTAE